MPPNRRDVLTWITATAAVGCATTAPLPGKSSFSGGAGGDTGTDGTSGPTPDSGDTGDGLGSGGDGGGGGASGGSSGSGAGTGDDTGAEPAWTCDQGEAEVTTPCSPSSPQGEGPYYLDDVPEGAEMNRRGAVHTHLTVDLRILDSTCTPLAGVVVDLWHADEEEVYDMTGDHHCRGRLVTGADGTVCFSTLRPPPYSDGMGNYLPAHLHLNLLRDGAKVLTTQLYFQGDPYLSGAPAELVCTPQVASDGSERIQVDLVLPGPA